MYKKTCLAMVLALMLVMALSPLALAQDSTPPTWKPPTLTKTASPTSIGLGEQVVFTFVVVNPGTPGVDTTWYNLRLTDVLDKALRIDNVTTTMGTVSITDQTVVINGGITLEPGAWFEVKIYCTLVGPVPSSGVLTNSATLEYTNGIVDPQPPVTVETEVKIKETPPVIPEASTLLLLGSAASGMAGYVGLQIRARRRKES
jgi:uncharacterized repeat protein (TIGR01451 family)